MKALVRQRARGYGDEADDGDEKRESGSDGERCREEVIAAKDKTEQSKSYVGEMWEKANKQCKATQANMDEP